MKTKIKNKMNKRNLEKEILQKIKEKGIKPKPKFFFILKNFFFWFLSIFFVLIGGISFALILYKISGNYQIFLSILNNNLKMSETVIYLVPYFWIILLIIFLFLAIFNYKKTKLFYRVPLHLIILGAIFLSFIFGTIFFYAGFASKTEEISQKYLPFYNKYQKIQEVKKKIFVSRLKQIGVTREILEQNSDLKKQVQDKFDKNVLGKTYLYRKPEVCLKETFKCKSDQIFFEDKKGCGCREIYSNLKF